MKQLTSLLWKEWIEVRLFIAIGLFVFLGLPLIGAIENQWGSHFDLAASIWVCTLGGLLAVIIGVGIVVRDLNGRLEEFWRSRPVSTAQWLLVKYFVGLAVVLIALGVPLVIETLVRNSNSADAEFARLVLKLHPVLWAALYSLSFAIASLLRRGAHAAMLSIAVMLLLYFLPSVLPPIHFLSLGYAMDQDQVSAASQIEFVLGMIGLSAIGLTISLAAVRHDWRIEPDRKLIYWSIGGALLILFSSAAFQVASNMPLLAKKDLPVGWDRANFLPGNLLEGYSYTGKIHESLLCRVRPSSAGFDLQPIEGASPYQFLLRNAVWRPEHPDIFYAIGGRFDQDAQIDYPELVTIDLSGNKFNSRVQSLPAVGSKAREWVGALYEWKDRLFILGSALQTFDLTDPTTPRLISRVPSNWRPPWDDPRLSKFFDWRLDEDFPSVTISLPQIPELPARQRLELAVPEYFQERLTGDTLIHLRSNHLTTYQLESLTEDSATFRLRGRYDPTPVEELFGASINSYTVASGGGLLYVGDRQDVSKGSMIGAFDLSGSRPKPVGHFAIPDESLNSLCLLSDGRLLVASAKHVYLLGPPPGRK